MPVTPDPNAPSSIYKVELYSEVNGVFCRNTFHVWLNVPVSDAALVSIRFDTVMLPSIQQVTSAYVTFLRSQTTLVTGNYPDAWTTFYDNKFGNVAAIPADPRLCVYWHLRSNVAPSEHYTGGNFLSGIPSNYVQGAPKLNEAGVLAHRNALDFLVSTLGKNPTDPFLRWGIFSRTLFVANPNAPWFWFQPISNGYVRNRVASLRTRRPRGPF